MTEPGESPKSRQSCVAPTEHAQSPSAVVLPRGRLDRLVHQVAGLYRKAHLTGLSPGYAPTRNLLIADQMRLFKAPRITHFSDTATTLLPRG
jgi:hypothetical protein